MPIKFTIKTERSGPSFAAAITWPIKCPECGHETQQSLSALKNDPILDCPACSHKFKIESQGTAQRTFDQVAKIDRLLDKLGNP